MTDIICDDTGIRKALEKLGEVLYNSGSYFHPDLQLVCRDNNFSIHSTHPIESGSVAVHIPEACLINYSEFSFSVQGGQIAVESAGQASIVEQELVELVVELYNRAGKLNQSRASAIYSFYYKDPDLYRMLTKGLRLRPAQYLDEMPQEQVFFDAFMDLRILNTVKENGKKKALIVPMIEYFNHDSRAHRTKFFDLKTPDTECNGLGAYAWSKHGSGSDELFIKYGFCDARELLFYQGYLEPDMSMVKSLELEFDIRGKKIVIDQKLEEMSPEKIPADLADLHGHCPYFDYTVRDTVQFSFLYIPGGCAPLSLRRLLFHGFSGLTEDKDEAHALADAAERKIVSANYEYYKNLKIRLDTTGPFTGMENFLGQARDMVESQLSRIENYAFFKDAMGQVRKARA